MIPGYETVDHDKIEHMLAARLEALGIPAEALDAPVSDSSTPPHPRKGLRYVSSFAISLQTLLQRRRPLRSVICITVSAPDASRLRNKG